MATRYSEYITLKGSHKHVPKGGMVGGLDKNQPVSVTVVIRPKEALPQLAEMRQRRNFDALTKRQYASRHGASQKDIDEVLRFAHHAGLSATAINPAQRSVELRGTIIQLESAFGCELNNYASTNGDRFRARSGPVQIPKELEGIVTGVFGLDNRPVATPKFQPFRPSSVPEPLHTFFANELADLYSFPSDQTGKKQCVGIVELGGGYREDDFNKYFTSLDLQPPRVIAVSVDGGINHPTTPDSADGEVMLDIEVAGAIEPDALLVVYFAPNTDKGFLDAINAAIHDTRNQPGVISISWGAAEDQWTEQSLNAYNEAFQAAGAMGVTVCAASGDRGSDDGVNDGATHVDFPSSSPYVVACGGTRVETDGKKITSEIVWHESEASASGGGVSNVFKLPAYQASAKVPVSIDTQRAGRGVPDVAANADPSTGYRVRVDGTEIVIGGTSAVAPLIAGLITRLNEARGKKAGFIHPKLYSKQTLCRDIVEGNNITTTSKKGYSAGKGWDACTGLGAPIGTRWLSL